MALTTKKQTASIEIVSDTICPWCFVGKRRFEKALGLLGDQVQARVVWRAFELNPDTPPEGVDREGYLRRKYGLVRVQQMQDHLARAAAAEGIPFQFERIQKIPNTFDSHRLIWFAETQGLQDAVVEGLFQAYFVEGQDIGNRDILTAISHRAGLSPDSVRQMLESDRGRTEVRAEEEKAFRHQIHGVPTFIVNDQVVTSGAQPPEVLARAVGIAAIAADGASCSRDGTC